MTRNRLTGNPAAPVRAAFSFIACAAAALLIHTGCAKKEAATETIADIQKREGVPVRVVTVRPDTLTAVEIAGGTAEGYVQTTVKAAMAGRLAEVKVRVGDPVAEGSSMMTIDPSMPQNYTVVKAQYENAEKALGRVKALAGEGGVSQEVLDQVETGFTAAREGLNAVKKSQFVIAPHGGTVVNVHAELNSTVEYNTQLVTIAKIDRIRVPFYVSETSINRYRRGQAVRAIVGQDTVAGNVDKVAMAGQAVGHNFEVDAVFDNASRLLKPGMHVTLRVVVEKKEGVISLPVENVSAEGGQRFVYTVRDGAASRADVAVGIRGGDRFEIVSGLSAGDVVVVAGASGLTGGTRVRIVQ